MTHYLTVPGETIAQLDDRMDALSQQGWKVSGSPRSLFVGFRIHKWLPRLKYIHLQLMERDEAQSAPRVTIAVPTTTLEKVQRAKQALALMKATR